jgi:hypothetical protein
MLNDVVTGVLVDVIFAAGRRVGTGVLTSRGRRYRDEIELARWFDTYRLADTALELPALPAGVTGERLGEVLRRDEFHSVLHELLAVRLTDAPEMDARRVRTALRLTLSSAFIGVDVSMLADALFEYYDGRICELVGRLQGTSPGLLEKIRQEALGARTIAVLHAIERHMAALAGQADPQADAEFIGRYCRHVREHHGKLEPPDFDRRRRVPIADLYVVPSIIQVDESEPAQLPRVIDLWVLAEELDRTVLLGDPGGGKTSAAHVLMDHHGRMAGGRVPFMITLREFAAEDPPARSVVRHIENRMEAFYQCPPTPGLVERLLLSGAGLAIFDGLDELVDTARRADVTAIIEQFAAEYPLVRILVTSRQVGYDEARLDDQQFVRYRIGGFDEARTASYVAKWFSQEQEVAPADALRWADAFMAESADVADLRSNPLMLALMCILYRGEGSIPRNRPEVYESCSNLLFRKWDARRRIHVELRARHLVEPALRHLAFWLFTRGQTQAAVTERDLIEETARFLHGRGFESTAEADDAAREFVAFCRGRAWVFSDAGTTADGQRLYAFTHRTFLEYFAAAYLAATCDTPEKLARTIGPHVARQEWEVVADLATQIKDRATDRGAERIIAALLTERRHRSTQSRSHILEFLAHGLRFVDPPPQTVRELSQNILDHAFSGNPDDKRRCHPLHHLIVGCSSSREIVKDEITERAHKLASSAGALDVLNGLRLAVWADDTNIQAQNSRVGNWNQELWEFWNEIADSSVIAYSDAIIAAANHNTAMKYTALVRGLLTAEQILTGEQPDMDALFTMQPTFFGIIGPPHLFRQVHDLIRGRNWYRNKDPMPDFGAFGRFAMDHPSPPFVTNPTGYKNWFAELEGSNEPQVLPDAVTHLGASLAFAIGVEASDEIPLHAQARYPFGSLSDLYPHVMRRYRVDPDAELPTLPFPRLFRELFESWANREIDFTRAQD